jgi:hypothetical protein
MNEDRERDGQRGRAQQGSGTGRTHLAKSSKRHVL